jgi:O-antigen/teichoic acid export membrane protein
MILQQPASQPGICAAAAKERIGRHLIWDRLGMLLRFSTGQVALQGLTAFTGLCLVRWLAMADYAVFGLSLTLQSALGLIVDLGVTSAIMALTGGQYADRAVLGRYIQAGLHLRSRLLLIGAAVGAAAIYVIGKRQHWPWPTETLVFTVVIAGVLVQFWISIYGVPLILNQHLGRYYAILTGAAALRLIAVLVLRWAGVLTAGPALMAGTAASFGAALTLRRLSRRHWEAAGHVNRQAASKIIHYIAPRAPLVAFQSLQGQMALFAVSYFGSPKPMAETGALGRLGQLFILLNAFNWMVLGPRFARIGKEELRPFYLQTVGIASGVSTLAACAAFLWPGPLLWLIGPKYANLEGPLRYVAAAACIAYVSTLMLVIHNNRQWVYWWSAWLEIGLVLGVQAGSFWALNLGTTLGASQMAFYTSIAILFVQILVGWSSLTKRKLTYDAGV